MQIATPVILTLALAFGAPAAHAQDTSIQAVLEKYNMLGTFAINCTQPASMANYYLVRRPLDAAHIQSDIMTGPTERLRASVIDRAAGLGPNEISISFTSEGHGRASNVVRAEADRHRTLEVTNDKGEKTVVDGYQVNPRVPMPWLNKCDPTATRAVFEKYNLLGTFAIDCRKPASKTNHYAVLRPLDSGGIQFDTMLGPTERVAERVIDRAAGSGPTEISGSFSTEQADFVYSVEANRFRVVSLTRLDGEKFVADGRVVKNGAAMPWMNKCR